MDIYYPFLYPHEPPAAKFADIRLRVLLSPRLPPPRRSAPGDRLSFPNMPTTKGIGTMERNEGNWSRAETFSGFKDSWAEMKMMGGSVSPHTMKKDLARIEPLERYLGPIPLKEINPAMIAAAYVYVVRDKRAAGDKYSAASLFKMHSLAKQILSMAVSLGHIEKNPALLVPVRRPKRKEMGFLREDELKRLAAAVEEDFEALAKELLESFARWNIERGEEWQRRKTAGLNRLSYLVAVRIAIATGAREGEIFGLAWEHFDESAPSLLVARAIKADGKIGLPKSLASLRRMAIDEGTAEMLRIWREVQTELMAGMGLEVGESTLILVNSVGKQCNMSMFWRWWSGWREEKGFPGLRFHELRHTQVSQLIAHGMDLTEVQARMGHSTPSMTLAYSHLAPARDQAAAAIMEGIISGLRAEAAEK